MNHTPKPWQADLVAIEDEDNIKCVQVYGPEGQGHGRVAQVYAECGRPEELWHNVHLIEQAPNLLLACEAVKSWFDGDRRSEPQTWQELAQIVESAIAKARGSE